MLAPPRKKQTSPSQGWAGIPVPIYSREYWPHIPVPKSREILFKCHSNFWHFTFPFNILFIHGWLKINQFSQSNWNGSIGKFWQPYLRGDGTEAQSQGWAGNAFWLPGTAGREIENHIPVLREGNGNSQIATGREGKGNLRLVIPGIPGNPGNHIKSKIKFKIIFMPWQAIRSQSFFNQCKDDICNRFTQL